MKWRQTTKGHTSPQYHIYAGARGYTLWIDTGEGLRLIRKEIATMVEAKKMAQAHSELSKGTPDSVADPAGVP